MGYINLTNDAEILLHSVSGGNSVESTESEIINHKLI